MLRSPVPRRMAPVVMATALLLAGASVSPAQSPRSSSVAPSEAAQLEKLAANAKRDIAKYRATLPPVLAMFERELARQTELAAARLDLYERGALSESEVRAGKRTLAAAQKDVDDTRRDMAAADRMMGEARMADVGIVSSRRIQTARVQGCGANSGRQRQKEVFPSRRESGDRKSTRLNSSHGGISRMPSSA